MIVKYQLENRTTATGTGLTAPECINDGGQFMDTDGTLIGYSDGTYPLGVTCTEITEEELEARKLRLANTRECAVRSDGQASYVESLDNDTNGFMVAKAYPGNTIAHYYKGGDSSCEFYSERTEGRKKYWSQNIPAEKYSQPDSDSQILAYYSEMAGVTQEWYYDFTTFEGMVSFVNSHAPITLNPTLEAKMRDNPVSVKATSIKNANCMYLASLEVTASGVKTTTIYVTAQPADL